MKKKALLIGFASIAIVTIGAMHACSSFWEAYNASHPSGSNKYYEMLTDLSPLEGKYMKLGSHSVGTYSEVAEGTLGNFRVWYPSEMETSTAKYPVIVSNNGTGWPATKYPEWFYHMASWGFIVVGNDEGTSWNGDSAEKTLQWILGLNAKKGSPFYGHIDESRIGTVGHSQGGTGVENAITVQPSASKYKAAVMLASTYNGYNAFLKWDADASKIRIPLMVLVSNEDGLTPLKDYNTLWNALPSGIMKIAGRRTGCGHGDMLVYADGYVTAWFMWLLNGDTSAREAIRELKTNSKFVEVRSSGI